MSDKWNGKQKGDAEFMPKAPEKAPEPPKDIPRHKRTSERDGWEFVPESVLRAGGETPPGLDVVIQALIKKLPTDGAFDANARVRWLRQIEMAFQGAYGDVENGSIEIAFKKNGES